jgi:hypothetical protein
LLTWGAQKTVRVFGALDFCLFQRLFKPRPLGRRAPRGKESGARGDTFLQNILKFFKKNDNPYYLYIYFFLNNHPFSVIMNHP